MDYRLLTGDYVLTTRDSTAEENYDEVCLRIRDHRIRRGKPPIGK